jgi:hypothetical protein
MLQNVQLRKLSAINPHFAEIAPFACIPLKLSTTSSCFSQLEKYRWIFPYSALS